VLLYQLWSFLAPAVEERTQRVVSVFAAIATFLFAGGVAFAYFVILPRALSFLTNFNEDVFEIQIRASYYFSFVTMMLLATGLAFEMPIFILALVRLRILTAEKLRRNRRVGLALMLVFAVLLPTVDPVSLALEVIPLALLFELSIHLASLMERRWQLDDEPQEVPV
jgi:sec-independent protein translocase protein TatC